MLKCLFDVCGKYQLQPHELLGVLLKTNISIIDGITHDVKNEYSRIVSSIPNPQKSTRKFAEDILNAFTIHLTGARVGDILIGTSQAKDAMIQIVSHNIPPTEGSLNALREHPDLWKKFISKLSSVGYFEPLTNLERELWLLYNSENTERYLDDYDSLKVRFLQTSGGFNTSLSEDDVSLIMTSDEISPKEISDFFPKKPGSNGIKGKHTLIFRKSIWRITCPYVISDEFDGMIINLTDNSNVVIVGNPIENTHVFSGFIDSYISPKEYTSNGKIGFLIGDESIPFSDRKLYHTIALKISNKYTRGEYTLRDVKNILKQFKNFTPAAHKSLLQKIIRFRAEDVMFLNDEKYPSELVFACSFVELLLHPGSFVPDIQRYVTGMESAFKRLIVILYEDAFFETNEYTHVLQIISAAFLAQRFKGYRPDEYVLTTAITLGLDAIASPKAFIFNIPRGMKSQKYLISSENLTPLKITSLILDELKSFHSDLGLVRDIATHPITVTTIRDRPECMPIEHCVDQHWAPEVVYYLKYLSTIEDSLERTNKPFSGLMKRIFNEVTGVNPRRPGRKGKNMNPEEYTNDFEEKDFTYEMRVAQRGVLLSRIESGNPPRKYARDIDEVFTHTLDDGWLAGMIGAIEVKIPKFPPALVTIHPNDLNVFIAIRKPARDMKSSSLTPEHENLAIAAAKQILKKGVKILNPPVGMLKNCSVLRNSNSGEYIIQFPDDSSHGRLSNKSTRIEKWENVKKIIEHVKILRDDNSSPSNDDIQKFIRTEKENGVVKHLERKVVNLLRNTKREYIYKSIEYLRGLSNTFEFARISRDGGATKQAVGIDDIGAFKFVVNLSILAPAAIRKTPCKSIEFTIMSKVVLWSIIDIIERYISGKMNSSSSSSVLLDEEDDEDNTSWGDIGDVSQREMWPHQTSSVGELLSAHTRHQKGNFIHINAGLGKTKIVLEYLKKLSDVKELPEFVIYTLPSSAISSVINELEMYNFQWRLLIPLKNPNSNLHFNNVIHSGTPVKYHINLIEHDHLRRVEEEMYPYMTKAIFIIDEVHKALNETKRTSVALQFSELSKEFIALTGTPIIDTDTWKLMWWLQKIVSFHVTEKNFWVACNSMISWNVLTNVKVVEKEILAKFDADSMKRYVSLVSPNLGGKNHNPRYSDIQNALELCYSVSDEYILRLTKKILNSGHGIFIITRNITHLEKLYSCIREFVDEGNIFRIERGSSLFFTDETVASGQTPDYKIVLTTQSHSTGYTITRLHYSIKSVYPSNNATREQLSGRMNRIGQSSSTIVEYTVHCGILTHILSRHKDAKNLSNILRELAGEIV